MRAIAFIKDAITRWWVAFSLSTVCVVCGHLMIKSGLNATLAASVHGGPAARILHILAQPFVELGLLIYLFGTVCWVIAVSQKEISFIYPLSSINYVLVVVASAFLLAEPVHARRAEGVTLIVVGMILLNIRIRKVSR